MTSKYPRQLTLEPKTDWGRTVQSYSRDVLAFLFCILTLVAWITSNKPGRGTVLLNRPQTEEWKGWMQVPAALLITPCSS